MSPLRRIKKKEVPKKTIAIVTDDTLYHRHCERYKGHLSFLNEHYCVIHSNLENICINNESIPTADLFIFDFKAVCNNGKINESNYEKVKKIMQQDKHAIFIHTHRLGSRLKISPVYIQDILIETNANTYLRFNKFQDEYKTKTGAVDLEEKERVEESFRKTVNSLIQFVLDEHKSDSIKEKMKSAFGRCLYILNQNFYPKT